MQKIAESEKRNNQEQGEISRGKSHTKKQNSKKTWKKVNEGVESIKAALKDWQTVWMGGRFSMARCRQVCSDGTLIKPPRTCNQANVPIFAGMILVALFFPFRFFFFVCGVNIFLPEVKEEKL